jgi:hypothetical protein
MAVTPITGTLKVADSHRLFDLLLQTIVSIDAITIATYYLIGGGFKPGKYHHDFYGIHFDLTIKCPAVSVFEAALHGTTIAALEIEFVAGKKPLRGFSTDRFASAMQGSTNWVFLAFYERYRPWLQQQYGIHVDKWPSLFMFAWAIRNAVAHHAGKLNFMNPSFPAVTWHGLRYSPGDSGRQIIGTDLGLGDLVVLMFEMSSELDRAGCPVPF